MFVSQLSPGHSLVRKLVATCRLRAARFPRLRTRLKIVTIIDLLENYYQSSVNFPYESDFHEFFDFRYIQYDISYMIQLISYHSDHKSLHSDSRYPSKFKNLWFCQAPGTGKISKVVPMGTGFHQEKFFGYRWVLATDRIFKDTDPCLHQQ